MGTTLDNMTPAEARVAVAKDVLKLLDAKRIVAEGGTYFDANESIPVDSDRLLRDVLTARRACSVCALGALFYAQVMRFDGLKCDAIDAESAAAGFIDADDIHRKLSQLFDSAQRESIEDYFEGRGDRGSDYANTFDEEEDCLRDIMRNIIDNGGTFTPQGATL